MNNPKISIVIPVYNEEKYVQNTIDSLLGQTEKELEIILIDDGSTDNSLNILKSAEEKNPNKVRVFTQKNSGPGAARNLGVKEAKGQIIVLVDADMKFDKNYVKDLTTPVQNGESKGTYHVIEKIANLDNIWARAWRPRNWRMSDWKKAGKSKIFRALKRKDFLDAGGFNPSKGYFDDIGLAEHIGLADPTPAICYHYNPSSLSEVFWQMVWIGSSFPKNKKKIKQYVNRMKNYVFVFFFSLILMILILFLLKINFFLIIFLWIVMLFVLNTGYRVFSDRYITHFFAIPIFMVVKFLGFSYGFIKGLANL